MVELPTSASGKTAEEVARMCAQEAGRIIMTHFGRHEQMVAVAKGRGNFVTEADLAAEHAVLDLLRREYPRHAVLSEECGRVDGDSEYLWIVDPLDGTYNYSRRIPVWCTSIALSRKGEGVLGVILDPSRDELFFAEKGGGAFLATRVERGRVLH